jgi:SecD/SecF fusion protein
VTVYLAVILAGLLFALPNVLPASVLERWPSFLPNQPVALGLDLRGGSHLVLEVDGTELKRERVRTLAEDARRTLREANVPWRSVQTAEQGLTVTLRDAGQMDRALDLLSELASPVGAARKDMQIAQSGADTVQITLTAEGLAQSTTRAVEQSLEVIRQRVDQVGVSEPTIQRVGADRILVQLPGLQDPAQLRALLGSTAKMTFHLLGEPGAFGTQMLEDAEGNTYPVRHQVELAGDRLSDASAGFDSQTGEPIVNFRFDREGARLFGAITEANVGRPFAIVLDGKVLSAPVIREPILGGSGQISGNFTVQEAGTLSALLRAGALPAKLTVIEERSVGADLGADVIQKGVWAGVAAFAFVFLFMFVLYGGWGLVANIALALNVVLTVAGMSLLGATLTLPGIAGIVLGIGLAVDANVLINERIREETVKGKSALVAIDAGFQKAYATVMDSNITALLGTLLLFWFGSGPVRGFAITMALGILISMFTAVSVVKVIMIAIARARRLKTIQIRPLLGFRPIPDHTTVDFMKARRWGLGLVAALVLGSAVLLTKPGLNFGIDFRGGIQMEVAPGGSGDPTDSLARYRAQLDGLGLGEVSLQTIGREDRFLVRVERQPGGEAQQTAAVERLKAAIHAIDPQASFDRTEVVGPKVSGELATAGVLAVILAALAMLVYIWVRFEWPFAVGAILTLVLDVALTLGVFAITGLDFSLTAIAALLTLVGYSVNDKVVVYDRMRENLRLYRKKTLLEVINLSVNQTLTRSLYTSVTAFLAVLPLAVWGGSAVASFAIPMAFGIVIAAASSVFVAAPILLLLGDWRGRRGKVMFAPDPEVEDGKMESPRGRPAPTPPLN